MTTKNKLTEKDVKKVLANSKVTSSTLFDKCTVVAAQLPSGFVIVESSSCLDPANYDKEVGFNICINRIVDKIYELEGYRLQEKMSRKS